MNESPADWDPEFMKGLAIILPNDLPVESPETNSRKDKLHFSGIKNRVKETKFDVQGGISKVLSRRIVRPSVLHHKHKKPLRACSDT